jgi:hypothetical protein
MLQMPRRSVTRFFIPLIDVLTLLFCVFLMMPLAKPGDGSGPKTPEERAQELQKTLETERRQHKDALTRLEDELAKARQQQVQDLKKELWVRMLEVDPRGRVFFYDPDRVEIANAAQAQNLVRRDRREQGDKKLYYLLAGLRTSRFPTVGQEEQFENSWFKGVTVGYAVRSGAEEK